MHVFGDWIAPKSCPRLTDIEFNLKNGEKIMVSWESATFGKRRFQATGVSTTDDAGRVTIKNLHFLKDNIESLERVHYLSDSEAGTCVKSVTFVDQVPGHYKSEEWTFFNPNYQKRVFL